MKLGFWPGSWHTGEVGEMMIFSRALPPGHRQHLEQYLKAKWGRP